MNHASPFDIRRLTQPLSRALLRVGSSACSALIHATLATGNAPRDDDPATRNPAAAMSVAISRAASCLE